MSVAVVLQALGWVSVVWLVVVHALVQRGRLPRDGMAYRIAGCVAAGSVVTASVVAEIWPVVVLGLLWLRIEVFGHRHHVADDRTETTTSDRTQAGMPGLLVHTLGPAKSAGRSQPPNVPHPQPHHSRPHLPHPHLPHPHLDRRTVDRVFKIEMGIVITVAVVLFGIWTEQQRAAFGSNTNRVVCSWIDGC